MDAKAKEQKKEDEKSSAERAEDEGKRKAEEQAGGDQQRQKTDETRRRATSKRGPTDVEIEWEQKRARLVAAVLEAVGVEEGSVCEEPLLED